MTNLSNRTVGDIVSENYHAAGVFRQFGIDFCCGGGKLLSDVCEKKELSLKAVQVELEKLACSDQEENERYDDWTPSFLIDYIENNHHAFVRRKCPEIAAYAAKVARVHGGRNPENKEIFSVFSLLANELMEHLESEETTVFPLIKSVSEAQENGQAIPAGKFRALRKELEQMEEEHEAAGESMKRIRELSNSFTPPQDACATYKILYKNLEGFEEDLHKHVHLENNILFKKAEALLR